jgi:hypothetical protein
VSLYHQNPLRGPRYSSGDDKIEEEEFEDLPSDVEGDASEVGNTSAQEKFDKIKKAVKESSKDNGKKS